MATSTLGIAVPETVVLYHDHGPASAVELERLLAKVQAARTLGLDFTLSTVAGEEHRNSGGRCLDLSVSVSAERIRAQQITERGLAAARLALVPNGPGFERALIAHTAEAIADLTEARS